MLTAFLDFHRDTIRVRCAELATNAGPPTVTMTTVTPTARPVELVAHLRWLEYFWCEVVLAGRSSKAPYTEQEPAASFRVREGTTLAQALADYERQCESSRQVLSALDLDYEVDWHDRRTNVRWVFLHLIEETARHNGHFDAVRELISGPTDG